MDRAFPVAAVRRAWDAFPRRHAQTQRFSLGVPRSFVVSDDGTRVAYVRSMAGDDPIGRLWVHDVVTGKARVVADPAELTAQEADLPAQERARRERVRESASGITSFATDAAVTRAAFSLGGRLFATDLATGTTAVLDRDGTGFDPRPDPHGIRVAFVRDGGVWVAPADGGRATCLVSDDDGEVTWGIAEFIAAEEMNRHRGYWWAPDGAGLLVARVDETSVRTWHVHDPAAPGSAPTAMRYPAAGTGNADVGLAFVAMDGARVDVVWDHDTYPYLAEVSWTTVTPILAVQSRDQRRLAILEVDPASGATSVRSEVTDDHWVELVPGLPRLLDDGRLLHWIEDGDADRRRLAVDGRPVSPADLQLRGVVTADSGAAIVSASDTDPTAVDVWRVPFDGSGAQRLSTGPGVHHAAASGSIVVMQTRTLAEPGTTTEVRHPGGADVIAEVGAAPELEIRPTWATLGASALRTALLLPTGWTPADGPLPVLMDPYGGPHAQRVLRARSAFGTSQWFADAGYAVLVVDGRGSPGRGHAWERAVAGDLAAPPLEDQIEALHAAAERFDGCLDLERVGIRGWSFGGYLAALAVLRRPDVFHAAVAGAPVTEWRLYDTHYTERYLGEPDRDAGVYDGSSLLPLAADLERPLLLIHGLADDNVVAAHTLQLSRALLEAGRPHRVLPLVGVTHMTPQAQVAEALLRFQLDFLDDTLGRRN